MEIVRIVCPSCGAPIEVDNNGEFGFCSFCGTKIYIPNAVQKIRGTVKIDTNPQINNLLLRARTLEKQGKICEAGEYYNRVLDIDFSNKEAQDGYARAEKHITEPNLSLCVVPSKSGYSAIQVFIDAKKVCKLNNDTNGYNFGAQSQASFMLPVGQHIIRLKRSALEKAITINIENRNQTFEIVCEHTLFSVKTTVNKKSHR